MTRGEKIRAARKAVGLTQTQLGSRVGVTHAAIGQWERDEVEEITYKDMVGLSRATQKPLSYFEDASFTKHATGEEPAEHASTTRTTLDRAHKAMENLSDAEFNLVLDFIKVLVKARRLNQPDPDQK